MWNVPVQMGRSAFFLFTELQLLIRASYTQIILFALIDEFTKEVMLKFYGFDK